MYAKNIYISLHATSRRTRAPGYLPNKPVPAKGSSPSLANRQGLQHCFCVTLQWPGTKPGRQSVPCTERVTHDLFRHHREICSRSVLSPFRLAPKLSAITLSCMAPTPYKDFQLLRQLTKGLRPSESFAKKPGDTVVAPLKGEIIICASGQQFFRY